MKLTRRKGIFIYLASLFALYALFIAWNIYSLFYAPMLGVKSPSIQINIERATTAHQFAYLLKSKKLIRSAKLLLLIIRFEHLAHQLKAGLYEIQPGETAVDFLHKVVTGDVVKFNFTIVEGTTQQKIISDLLHAPYLEYNALDWQSITAGHLNAEGLLLADTYQYPAYSSAKTVLLQANQQLNNCLNDNWDHRATELPYHNPYELLIAASIIEKESAIPAERKLISGVIINRLRKGMPLQMDPTVVYALGTDHKGPLVHEDLAVLSPYNTYRYRGLPPTPIAMVTKEAIDAAAHPQLSHYLYFVAKGDGSHQFSETYVQQKQAINQYKHKGK